MNVDEIDRIAVLGAGNMGHGIAEVAAIAGFSVALRDISEELVTDGLDSIEWSLGKLVEHGRLSQDEADATLDRIDPLVDLETAVEDADVVIEAVPERMEVKTEVYKNLSAAAPERTVFASNTSSLSITVLSEATDRPERFCGMHFFNPPVRMELVEVIRGAHTADATIDLIEGLAEAMDKTPVIVRKDSPGFIVNRILTPLLNEAAWMIHEGEADLAAIDSTTKYDMGLPMGAGELTDQVGLDVALDVLEYLNETLGAAYEPCPLLEEKVAAGELGQKSGIGFYDYDNGGVDIPPDAGTEAIATRLTAMMANEVAGLVDDGVSSPSEIDRAMQLGTGFPDGPARRADEVGLETLHRTLLERQEATDADRYKPSSLLERYAEAGRGFYETGEPDAVTTEFEAITVAVADHVGRITLDRPHRMNTITFDMLDEIEAALDTFVSEDVRAVLITGAGDRAFSAGADVTAFTTDDPVEAAELSRRGQAVFGRFESAPMPIVAAIDGYCFGGGMELASACDIRVASEGSEFGQTEHNLGLMPGWGGTQRLPLLVGEARAREIILTAERYDVETMAEYGFVSEVFESNAFEDGAEALATDLAAGPPIAHRYTKRALLASRNDSDAGFEVEAEAFGLLRTTDDLMEGITAFMEDRDPDFEGA